MREHWDEPLSVIQVKIYNIKVSILKVVQGQISRERIG